MSTHRPCVDSGSRDPDICQHVYLIGDSPKLSKKTRRIRLVARKVLDCGLVWGWRNKGYFFHANTRTPSTQITFCSKTRQSVRCRGSVVTIPGDRAQVNWCILKPLIPEGSEATTKKAQTPRKCCLRRATNDMFSKFRGWRHVKRTVPRVVIWTALRALEFNSTIRGQTFLDVACFFRGGGVRST